MLCGDRVTLSPPGHLHAADGALELSPTPGRHGKAWWCGPWAPLCLLGSTPSAPPALCVLLLSWRGHYESLSLGWSHQQVCKVLV